MRIYNMLYRGCPRVGVPVAAPLHADQLLGGCGAAWPPPQLIATNSY